MLFWNSQLQNKFSVLTRASREDVQIYQDTYTVKLQIQSLDDVLGGRIEYLRFQRPHFQAYITEPDGSSTRIRPRQE